MVIRKITIDNSVKYVPIIKKDIKQNTTKNKKKIQKIIKNLLKILQQADSECLQNNICINLFE